MSEVKLPMLTIALLVLVFLGLDGILLIIAAVLEHATPKFGIKARASRPKTVLTVPPLIPPVARLRFQKALAPNRSAKEKVHEHACAG